MTDSQQSMHYHFGKSCNMNRPASETSCIDDASSDQMWFKQHPKINERERSASSRELQATGLPPGTKATVIVTRGPHGSLIRALLEPEFEQN